MSDHLLLFEALVWLGVARFAILALPLRRIKSYLGHHLLESKIKESPAVLKRARRISWAVRTMSRYTPWNSNCFPQAIAAKRMLQRRQIASTLYLGFSKEGPPTLEGWGGEGHAWLRCGPLYLTGGQNRHRFVALSTFAEEDL
jgi:hypothetical protein